MSGRAHQRKTSGNPYLRIWQQPCQNGSSTETIPAFGLVRVAATTPEGVLIVEQPDADGQDVYINGPVPIQPNRGTDSSGNYVGGYGQVSRTFPIWAAYNDNNGNWVPAIGDPCGPAAGSYLLTQNNGLFIVQAAPVVNTPTPHVFIAPPQEQACIVNVNSGPDIYGYYDLTLDFFDPATGQWTGSASLWGVDGNG